MGFEREVLENDCTTSPKENIKYNGIDQINESKLDMFNCIDSIKYLSKDIDILDYEDLFMRHLEENMQKAKKSELIATKLYENVRKLSQLKITEADVPKGILPSKYSMSLIDVRVGGYGPDEKTYRNNKWIRENVTRGMTFMRLIGKEEKFDLVIYANKKFTGGIGDEDEHQPENNDVWREFCLESPEKASEVICMTKLNGEAGHFTVRSIGGEFYIIAGSKNVHLIYKDLADIDLYSESRYMVAKTVAKAVLSHFHKMDESKLIRLKQQLHNTKMTVVCEVLQPHYQHIVDLSHLQESTINALMLASIASNEENSFTALPPHKALDFLSSLGLPTAPYQSISVEKVPNKIHEIRGMMNSEGHVLYYLQGNRTIGLAKVKTAWYVLLRALREKTDSTFNGKKNKDSPLSERIKLTQKRFKQIQNWIKFSNDYLKKWENLAERFLMWLDKEIKKKSILSKDIRPKFPSIWRSFLKATKQNDDIQFETMSGVPAKILDKT